MSTQIAGLFAILFYLSASFLLGKRLMEGNGGEPTGKSGAIALGIGGALLHGIALYPLLVTAAGLDIGFFNALSLIGLLTAALLLLASIERPVENLGIILLPIAALSIALMFAYSGSYERDRDFSWQVDLHILLSIVAFSVFLVAAVQAMMLAIQDRQLRGRHPGGFVRALPPMQAMERLLFELIGIGFVLLTASLVTGTLFLEDIFAQHLVHKTVLSLIAWIVFATLLWGRWRFGWRGQVAIRWTLGGFVFLFLAYLGSKLVLELILGR